jgi:hypothetical protein
VLKPGHGRSVPQFRYIFTFSGVSLALSSRIQIFSFHWKPCALALPFNLKNSKIGYRTRELSAFSGEAWSSSVCALVQTHLHFFGCFSSPEFQNQKFVLPLKTLRSCASIQPKKLENRISHEGAMSVFWWSLIMVGLFLSSNTSSPFRAFLWPKVPNPKFVLPLKSLRSCTSNQPKKLENWISHEGVWPFSGEAWSWSVRSSFQRHLHFFGRFSGPEF